MGNLSYIFPGGFDESWLIESSSSKPFRSENQEHDRALQNLSLPGEAAMDAAFIAPNFDGIPAELRRLRRWVTWKAEAGPGEKKTTKVPYRADLPNTKASSTDRETWCSFEQAEAAYLDGDRTGIGLVLDGTGNLAGVDIDNCRDAATEIVDPAALALLEGMGPAYVEVSPSGTGLRAFGYAPPLDTGCAGMSISADRGRHFKLIVDAVSA